MLDDKLREILDRRQYQDPKKPFYNDVIRDNIKEIKQVFADEGWIANTASSVRYMTGQEWYNKLMEEFSRVDRLYENDDDWLAKYSDFVEAAKKVIQ